MPLIFDSYIPQVRLRWSLDTRLLCWFWYHQRFLLFFQKKDCRSLTQNTLRYKHTRYTCKIWCNLRLPKKLWRTIHTCMCNLELQNGYRLVILIVKFIYTVRLSFFRYYLGRVEDQVHSRKLQFILCQIVPVRSDNCPFLYTFVLSTARSFVLTAVRPCIHLSSYLTVSLVSVHFIVRTPSVGATPERHPSILPSSPRHPLKLVTSDHEDSHSCLPSNDNQWGNKKKSTYSVPTSDNIIIPNDITKRFPCRKSNPGLANESLISEPLDHTGWTL